mmetsp:Transcript_16684/g.28369  ORF Transcript_16684/g.28369 Transcript_16684/m.28369 type:complete len:99 (+) Transcript_16684:758-1054(+)
MTHPFRAHRIHSQTALAQAEQSWKSSLAEPLQVWLQLQPAAFEFVVGHVVQKTADQQAACRTSLARAELEWTAPEWNVPSGQRKVWSSLSSLSSWLHL